MLKGNITDDDFWIHCLSNLPEEHNFILDDLDSCLTSTAFGASIIVVMHETLNHQYEKIKQK